MTEKDLIEDYAAFHRAILEIAKSNKATDIFWFRYLCWQFECWAAAKLDGVVPPQCVFLDGENHKIELMENGVFAEWTLRLNKKGRYPSWGEWDAKHNA